MAPPWTNSWDETKPADSDLANTLGSQGRQLKLDTRQRLDWQHVWGQNVNDDGGHRNIIIATAYMTANLEALKASGYSLTGSDAHSMIDLAGTWNTSGTPTGFKLNILDTASVSTSLLMDLQIGGTSKFKVTKAGAVTAVSFAGDGSALTGVTGVSAAWGAWGAVASGITVGQTFTGGPAAADGFLVGYVNHDGVNAHGAVRWDIYTDSGNPATTLRATVSIACVNAVVTVAPQMPICVPVRKGDYWKAQYATDNAGHSGTLYKMGL